MATSQGILIVGGGLAGIFCALQLAPRPVMILASAPLGSGASSVWAQGGLAAAVLEGDSPLQHANDTLAAGGGLVDMPVMMAMAQDARARIEDLLAYGVPFDRDLEGKLQASREAAHSRHRVLRVSGDRAGKAIMDALIDRVRHSPSIQVAEGFTAVSLLQEGGRVTGVTAVDGEGHYSHFRAEATVLATGGIGQLYAVTTNPKEARGIGLAIAARAGARIVDAEFVQFHPTAIAIDRDPAPLATEALRGEGAELINGSGERFMLKLHKDGELAPRDSVARGVFAEIIAGRGAFLDARRAIGDEFAERFPTVYEACVSAGLDPATMPIPIAPAEHYHMGGIGTDQSGRSSLAGLWAIGEVASTGVHGANRLASNSLLEAVVFAYRAAQDLKAAVSEQAHLPYVERQEASCDQAHALSEDELVSIGNLRQVMTCFVGVIRDGPQLLQALQLVSALEERAKTALVKNMATSALLITASAFQREESRGSHYRRDFPYADPHWCRHSYFTLQQAQQLGKSVRRNGECSIQTMEASYIRFS